MTSADGGFSSVSPLTPGFSIPDDDLGEVLEGLGIKLFMRERSLAQYVYWSVRTGLIEFLDRRGPVTMAAVAEGTCLTEAGVDSLLGVLCALRFVSRTHSGTYSLTAIARAYLVKQSPFCIAEHIEATGFPMPRPYLRGRSGLITSLKLRVLSMSSLLRYGSERRLINQHARNLHACAAAVRTGEFAGTTNMLDLAGGSGTLSIPLALDYPGTRVLLADLPESLPGIRRMLAAHGMEGRIVLQGLDALQTPWSIPEIDGIFIGNFLHGFDDLLSGKILKEAYDRLQPGGRIWVHEMLWRENRDGPLITALWNAAMRSGGPGRQRTGSEIHRLLTDSGFSDIHEIPTSGAFVMVRGCKGLS